MERSNFIRRLLFLVSVPKCACCGAILREEDGPLCPDCMKEYENVRMINCSACSRVLSRCTCTNRLLDRSYVRKLIKVYRYKPSARLLPSNELIYRLKRNNRRDVVEFLADELAGAIRSGIPDLTGYMLTSVPRRAKSVVQYGYDHARELARAVARRLSLSYASLLRSGAKKAQKKLSAGERIENAACFPRLGARLRAKKVILIDDIVTSGASMAAAATALHRLGAQKIVGAAIAIAYKESAVVRHTPPAKM